MNMGKLQSRSIEWQSFRLPDGGYVSTVLPLGIAKRICHEVSGGGIKYQRIFKDTEKALVGVVHIVGATKAVIKCPRSRSRRKWERFLTLFRDGESLRQFQQHLELIALGVNGPKPLLAVEWRKRGVVVNGFYLYEYIDGRRGSEDDRSLIAKELLKLYRKGIRRKDPKPENFIVSGEDVYLIDFSISKPVLFPRIRLAMELSQFAVKRSDYQRYARELDFSQVIIGLGWRLQFLSQRVRRIRRGIVKRLI